MSLVSTRRILTAFRAIAAAEAVTWAALLIGMFFKYVVVHNEIGVQIFGPVHGVAFIVYVAITLLAWHRLGWNLLTGVLALVASVPPFGTVIFERWASRTGRIAPAAPAATPANTPERSARA
ncbi:DUF3817 domain-containing protein [Nocardiopsis gilva YIM 90087]|uniref:DUF3817 domain-containing protein n=1 Tax=Nocardiopsis gilva YIM 90087 TaxID=1235441 RepID=A0A223S3Z8_9ACTN|nr:DUF3817 domain-containing protein [Nocardiopsis gilva]ASU82852.1 DUF3817 domain-containing protein [Nocardiopsis gilva YIM 90087]